VSGVDVDYHLIFGDSALLTETITLVV